jgi:hypothetical protein
MQSEFEFKILLDHYKNRDKWYNSNNTTTQSAHVLPKKISIESNKITALLLP